MAEVVSSVLVIINKILKHNDEIRVMKDELGRSKEYVRLLEPLLVKFQQLTRGDEPDAPWLTNLEKALQGLEETMSFCINNPIRTMCIPSRYTGFLKDALECIKEAMSILGVATNAMTAETKNAIGSISKDIGNVGILLASLEAQQQEMKLAMQINQRETNIKLEAIARKLGIEGGARELQTDLARQGQYYKNKLRTEKDSSYRIELEAALQISRLAEGRVCPKEFQCPLSLEIMENPVILVQSGQTYDRKQLQIALVHQPGRDPLTNVAFFGEPNIITNFSVKSMIDSWKSQVVSPYDQTPLPPQRVDNHRGAEEPTKQSFIEALLEGAWNATDVDDDLIERLNAYHAAHKERLRLESGLDQAKKDRNLALVKQLKPLLKVDFPKTLEEFESLTTPETASKQPAEKQVADHTSTEDIKENAKEKLEALTPEEVEAKKLVGHTIDYCIRDSDHTPLTQAVFDKNVNMVKALIKFGANVNTKNKNGETPLFEASFGHVEVVKVLLAAESINVNSGNNRGDTPLCNASQGGRVEVVKLLLAAEGIDVNKSTYECHGGVAPLIYASFGHVEIVKLLLGAEGINVNVATIYGDTPLINASDGGFVEVVKLLLAAEGIDVNAKNKRGRTALSKAVSNGHSEVADLLCSAGARKKGWFF